jgi:DNA-binding MarR family transcriptional regulator
MALDPDGYEALARFRYAFRQFLAVTETIIRQAGVTPPQYQALLAVKVWPAEAMAIKDLAEQLLLTHQAAVQMVDRLARAGLAEREPSKEDRRSVLIRLTAKGERLLDELAARHLEEMLRQEPLLTESLQRLRKLAS